jgi:hypothetical protein
MSVPVLYAQHQSRFVFTSVAVDPAVSQEVICNFEHSGNTEFVASMNHVVHLGIQGYAVRKRDNICEN